MPKMDFYSIRDGKIVCSACKDDCAFTPGSQSWRHHVEEFHRFPWSEKFEVISPNNVVPKQEPMELPTPTAPPVM